MQKFREDRAEEVTALRGKIDRLSSVQREAMDAGTLRARQILYWDSIKSDQEDASLTWRGAAEPLAPAPLPSARDVSPSRERDAYGERIHRADPVRPRANAESPG